MEKSFIRRIVRFFIIVAIILVAGVALYNGSKILKSENLKTVIAQRLAERTQMQVSIESADLYLLKGARIILTDFSLRDPEDSLFLKARKVNVGFSLLYLIRGKLHLRYIDLLEPEAIINFSELLRRKPSGKKIRLPLIKIAQGSLEAHYKEQTVVFHKINGRLNEKSIKLKVNIPTGRARLNAKKKNNTWEGNLSVDGFELKTLYKGIGGKTDINLGFEVIDSLIDVTARIDTPKISLPLGGEDLEQVHIVIRAQGNKDILKFEKIELNTGTINLSGKGELKSRNNKKIMDSLLELDFISDTFSYDALVSHFPEQRFSYWSHKFLFEMMREGKAKITEMTYKGPLRDFTDKEQLAHNFVLKGDVSDMSYGAGYGPERITSVKGSMIIQDGELIYKNLSGIAGKSKLAIKELFIPNIVCPGFDMFLKMNVDMPFEDFVYAWKAAMTPESANDLLGKINKVGSGHIKGRVTYQKNITDAPNEMKCDFRLDNASFFWNENFLEDVDGNIIAQELGSPVVVDLKGRLDNLAIEKFDLTLEDPFKERVYSYSIKTAGLPAIPGFSLDGDPVLMLKGTGRDRFFEGTARVTSKGFIFLENRYTPFQDVFKGEGTFSGQLWPEFSFMVADAKVDHPSGNNLGIELIKDGNNGTMTIKGDLNLNHRVDKEQKVDLPVKGGIHVALAWHEKMETTGNFRLTGFSYPYYAASFVLDGLIEMEGERLTTKGLKVLFNGSEVMISGFLNNKESHFAGDLDVNGLKIKKSESESENSIQMPESFTLDLNLALTDFDLMGILFEHGNVELALTRDNLIFKKIDIKGRNSKVNGSAIIDQKNGSRFDLELDLKDQGLEKLLNIFNPGDMFLKGNMRLYGHVKGMADAINGRLKFEAQKGHTQYFSLVSNLFEALNLYKVFNVKDLNLGRMRFSYNSISSTFKIHDSIVTFNDFYLDNNALQLSSMGQLHLNTKQIDAVVGIQPLETIDRAISALPVVGWVLTGKDNKLILLSLKIVGDISDPSISIARRGTITKPVAATLLKLLKLPETLMESSKPLFSPIE